MEKVTSEVSYYLKLTEYYLSGDLKEIKSICEKAEETDIKLNIQPKFSVSGLYPRLDTKNSFENPESGIFRLTIPIASALFSTIDFLGYLSGDNDNALATKKNFIEFFKYARNLSFVVAADEIVIVNSVFRQGVAHTYLPKLNAGISYYSGNPNDKLFLNEMGNTLVLNLRYLETIVMMVLRNAIENTDLAEKMENRYLRLQNSYREAYSDKIERLLRRLD
ncbi:MAG: hypothetical protein H7Y86_13545 [Rhizobacter sp.]|nr:hypothetical protein [Ferruginibacter sp.]